MLSAKITIGKHNPPEATNKLLHWFNAAYDRQASKVKSWRGHESHWKVGKGYVKGEYYTKKAKGYYEQPRV